MSFYRVLCLSRSSLLSLCCGEVHTKYSIVYESLNVIGEACFVGRALFGALAQQSISEANGA